LHYACLKGHLDLAQWLHTAGASLDATDRAGGAPLHYACSGGRLDVAQWLHSAGASLDATDRAGLAPLHYACSWGHLDVAQWLCSAGADATLKTNVGSTPAQYLQHRARGHRLDQQALRSTMACLVRRAQGPLLCTTAPIGVQH
jgi:ankyrin repeat protein